MKIAVIVPVYNGEKFLSEFISCFMRQTVKNFEVYFVDDCSTDNTSVLLQKAAEQNDSFHYMRNEVKSGAAISRNRGIECSKSDYILCLDADDLFADDLIEQLEEAADSCYADMVMLERRDYINIDCAKREIFWGEDEKKLYSGATFKLCEQPEDFLLRCQNATYDRMIKRELLDKYRIRFQNLPCSNDVFYIIFSTFAANRIIHTKTKDILYYRRIHSEPGRISNDRDPMCAFLALQAVRETLIKYRMWSEACVHFWIFALDSLEKQLFVCKNEERQRKVYQYLQEEGLQALGVPDDMLYEKLPAPYRKQFDRIFKTPYKEKCFKNSMSFQALCESNRNKIQNLFLYAKQNRLQVGFWGVGRITEGFLHVTKSLGDKIDYLIDNDKEKQGKSIFGIEIVAYSAVSEKVGFIVISNKQYYHEIYKQIKEVNSDIKVLSIQEYLYCNCGLEKCLR